MSVLARRSSAGALGVMLDRRFGEWRLGPHPVAVFGGAMARLEPFVWRDRRIAGVGYNLGGVAAAALIGRLAAGTSREGTGRSSVSMRRSALWRDWIAVVFTSWLTVAGRGLIDAASAVASPLCAGDLRGARSALPALVGRDPDQLDSTEISRAVVESIAENTVDAVVSPALWSVLGGAGGGLAYRAVNTLDSMVGHHSARYEHFGWASARLDDAANYVPARVCALLVIGVRPRRAKDILGAVRRGASNHPSPNAGVIESAFAAALDLGLGGVNSYDGRTEVRGALGTGRAPRPVDIAAAQALAKDVTTALLALLLAASALITLLGRDRRSDSAAGADR